ncbi:MAG: MoaD/ThiS family protein [Gemmatimonadota bacterium]|nr:MoaD/ThiS family protein [Gemmatimonadota bacterium]MDH5282541.1 MoaD/ThiS family protein [Gemmatimonadota bacterium]
MARVVFTANLQRHVRLPEREVDGGTVREVLEAVFRAEPSARGYVLDEQGALRRHMVVFVGGAQVRDRITLGDPVESGTEVCVMQALSGG